jgi:hypothetical protein
VLKLILVAALLMHGIGRVLGPMAAWTGLSSGFTGNPWIFGGNVAFSGSIGRLFSLVWVAALIVTVWAGVSLWSGNPNWRDLAIDSGSGTLACRNGSLVEHDHEWSPLRRDPLQPARTSSTAAPFRRAADALPALN